MPIPFTEYGDNLAIGTWDREEVVAALGNK